MKKGIGIIETIIVIGVIGVIATIAAPFYSTFQTEQQLLIDKQQIIQLIRQAQNKSITGTEDSDFGVHFDDLNAANPNRVVLFTGSSYNPADSTNVVYSMYNSNQLYSLNLSGQTEVVFNKVNGLPNVYGDFKIRTVDNQDNYFVITINQLGVVYLETGGAGNNYPGNFSLLLPTNSSTETITTPTFDWADSVDPDPGDTVTYTIYVDDNSGFSSPEISNSGLSSSTYTATGGDNLQDLTTYYWKVLATDGTNNTWSTQTSWSFNINTGGGGNNPPGSFSLSSPSNSSTENTTTPTFDWDDSIDPDFGDTVTYTIYVDNDSDFSSPLISQGSLSSSTYTATGGDNLQDDTTYYWYVEATDGSLTTDSTETDWSFDIDVSPSAFSLTSPTDSSTETTTTPTFDWEDSTDPGSSVTYTIYVDDDSNFSSPLISQGSLSSSTYTATGGDNLQDDTTYYWYVVATDGSNTTDSTETDWSFDIDVQEAPSSFSLSSPTNGSTETTTTPTFDWADSTDPDPGDSVTYTIYVDDDSNFSSPLISQGSLSSSTYTATGGDNLQDDTTYYWYVVATDGSLTTDSTETDWSFDIDVQQAPSSFSLSSPTNSSTQTTTTPTFDWADSTDPDPGDSVTYTIYVDDNSDFSSPLISQGSLSSSTYTATGGDNLQDDTTYYWYVVATDGSNTTDSTETDWSFDISVPKPPGAFSLTTPTNTSEETTITPTFDWEDSTDPNPGDSVTYTIYVDDNSDFSSPLISQGSLSSSTYTATGGDNLQDDTTYYWYVEATDGSLITDSTETDWRFDINVSPSTFSLLLPTDSSTQTTVGPTFDWEDSTDPGSSVTYTLYVDDNSDFSSPKITESGLTSSTYTVPVSGGSVSVRVSSGNDDAEENVSNGSMYLDSTDLELISDSGTNQVVGIRWQNVTVPQGVTVTNAYVEFTTDETDSGITNLVIYGEDVDNSSVFTTATNNISNRTQTTASVNWSSVPAWNSVGETHQTPNISSIIDEIVNRETWNSGNSLTLIIEGSGERTAESYNGSSSQAPLLVINYSTGLNNNETYYWYVEATDGSNTTDSTETDWSFDISVPDVPPSSFDLLTPTNSSTENVRGVSFDWEDSTDPGDPVSYTIYVDDNSNFSSPVIEESGLSSSNYTATLSDALVDGTYYWYVEATDGSYTTDSNQTNWSFDIDIEDWYVDQSVGSSGLGDDWSRAFQTIAEAIAVITSGDTVHIANGTYSEQISLTSSHSGVLGNYTTFINKSGDTNVIITGDTSTDLVYLDNADYIQIEGLNFDTGRRSIRLVSGSSYNIIEDCYIADSDNDSISIEASNTNYNTVSNTTISNAGDEGIYILGTGNQITYTTLDTVTDMGILISSATDLEIDNTEITNTGDDALRIDGCSNCSFHNLDISNSADYGISIPSGSDIDIYSSTIYNSADDNVLADSVNRLTIYGNDISYAQNSNWGVRAESITDFVMYKNLIYRNTNGGVYTRYAYESSWTNTIYNNTVVNHSGEYGLYLRDSTWTLRNNISNRNGTGFRNRTSSINHDYDNIYGNSTDYQGDSAATHDVNSAPLFANQASDDYNLTASSPCIDTGDPSYPNDPDGTRIDIGALYYPQ